MDKLSPAMNGKFNITRNSAIRRKLSFDVSKEIFVRLITSNCYYCNIEPLQIHKKRNSTCLYNGIDRLNSNLGYTVTNVVTCCIVCNRAKLEMSEEEFMAWVKKVKEFKRESIPVIRSLPFTLEEIYAEKTVYETIVGKKYGTVTVISKQETRAKKSGRNRFLFNCRCDCGNEFSALRSHIITKERCLKCRNTNKRGGKQYYLAIGQKFGCLTVKGGPIYAKSPGTTKFWIVRCDCGYEFQQRTNRIVTDIQHCCIKCVVLPETKSGSLANANSLFGVYRKGARKDNREFSISKELFFTLVIQDCYYCGQEPTRVVSRKSSNGDFIANGLDRVDNKIGYASENVVTCCSTCNFAKHIQSRDEFLVWIDKVYNFAYQRWSVLPGISTSDLSLA